MKSPPNSVLLLAALLIAAVAGAVGWIGRGMFTGRASSQSATAPPTAEISRAGSGSAASLTSQHSGGVSAEEPKVVAKRLFQAVLEGKWEEGSEAMLTFRFQQALGGCDEAAVAEMVEILMRYVKAPWTDDLAQLSLALDIRGFLMIQMAAFNPRKALDCQIGLMQAGMPTGPEDFFTVMALLAENDPALVQNVIDGLPLGKIRTSAQMAWWQARTKDDPEGVFQTLMNLDSASLSALSSYGWQFQELLQHLAFQAPEKALQAAAHLPENPFFSVQEDLARDWIKRDPKAAVQWAMEQNDAKTLGIFLACLPPEKHNLAEQSLRDNFLAISSKEPGDRVSLSRDLAARLAEQDIPEGVRWAATLLEDAREEASLAVAKAWIKQDVPAAAEWLATWPAGESRDVAVESLTNAIVEDDPESALTWAASIQAKKRFSLMQKALHTLTGKDPAAAERAMQTLSEEDRAVLSVMKRTGLGE